MQAAVFFSWWFGLVVWGPVVWIFANVPYERDCYLGDPPDSNPKRPTQTTIFNHQLNFQRYFGITAARRLNRRTLYLTEKTSRPRVPVMQGSFQRPWSIKIKQVSPFLHQDFIVHVMKGGLQKWCHLFTSFCCLKTKGDQHDGVGQNLGHQQAKDRSHRSAVCRRCRWCCSLVEDRELWEVSWEAFWKLLRFLFVFFFGW